MKRLVIAAAVLAAPASAIADPCELLDAPTAEKMHALLDGTPRFIKMCEPCGETVPGEPFEPTHMSISDVVRLDHQEYDIDYLYLQTSPSRYENVAHLLGCRVKGVSPSLRVESETPDGVLITADTRPVSARPDPVPEPLVEPLVAQLPAPMAPPVNHYTTIVHAVPWLAIAAIAGGAGFLFGIGVSVLVMSIRRRRAMEPRASRLTV